MRHIFYKQKLTDKNVRFPYFAFDSPPSPLIQKEIKIWGQVILGWVCLSKNQNGRTGLGKG